VTFALNKYFNVNIIPFINSYKKKDFIDLINKDILINTVKDQTLLTRLRLQLPIKEKKVKKPSIPIS